MAYSLIIICTTELLNKYKSFFILKILPMLNEIEDSAVGEYCWNGRGVTFTVGPFRLCKNWKDQTIESTVFQITIKYTPKPVFQIPTVVQFVLSNSPNLLFSGPSWYTSRSFATMATIWILDKSGIQMFRTYPFLKWSGCQMMIWNLDKNFCFII